MLLATDMYRASVINQVMGNTAVEHRQNVSEPEHSHQNQ